MTEFFSSLILHPSSLGWIILHPSSLCPLVSASDGDGVVKVVIFVVIAVIWGIGSLLSWVNKLAKQAKEKAAQQGQQMRAPDWGAMTAQAPAMPSMPPMPPPLPPASKQTPAKNRQRKKPRRQVAREQESEVPHRLVADEMLIRQRVTVTDPTPLGVHHHDGTAGKSLLAPGRPQRSDVSKNIRLMLQPAGVREAFLLGEILGKPKGSQ